jgi:4-carboxymuconolactone decarboxylase
MLVMSNSDQTTSHYQYLLKTFPEVMAAVENVGSTVRQAGPLDRKTTELIQLAVAAASQSTGAVHSHAKRALAAGATRQEVEHALLVLISTIGFPKVAAALSWVAEISG